MCAGFSQALGTSVFSHPLSLLSSAHFLIQQKYVMVCVYVYVLGLEVNESWGVKGQGGDSYNVARVSHESPFQLSALCKVCFGIFKSKCEAAAFQRVSLPRTSVVLCVFSLFTGCRLFHPHGAVWWGCDHTNSHKVAIYEACLPTDSKVTQNKPSLIVFASFYILKCVPADDK